MLLIAAVVGSYWCCAQVRRSTYHEVLKAGEAANLLDVKGADWCA